MENIREILPPNYRYLYDDIESGKILGASNHIHMISKMFIIISENYNDEIAKDYINKIGEYYKGTRGKSSYAILDAINDILSDININDKNQNMKEITKNAVLKYENKNKDNKKLITEYALRFSSDFNKIMIFDYSSTIEDFILSINNNIEIIIPESRTIDGGKRFLSNKLVNMHKISFIPDAAMLYYIKNVDAVFIGAETFYIDGTVFNTVGSDILALICKKYNVPYIVLTSFQKFDPSSIQGFSKEIIKDDLKEKLIGDMDKEILENINCVSIELISIDPDYISYVITEKGIIRPNNIINYI